LRQRFRPAAARRAGGSMSSDEIVAACAAVLVGCGLPAASPAVARARELAERAYRAPADGQFALPTQALARVMRALKARAVGEAARASVDENFVRMVTKVRAARPPARQPACPPARSPALPPVHPPARPPGLTFLHIPVRALLAGQRLPRAARRGARRGAGGR
jgi:hypothetical protein